MHSLLLSKLLEYQVFYHFNIEGFPSLFHEVELMVDLV